MPVGGNAQVTINVGARLQVLQSSVNEIQKVLDKLQPNSAGFKNLQTILNQITREMDRLQVQASKPFGSQNQFNQTEKTLDKIEDSLNNAQIALGRISFKDLKLSPDQEQQFKDLRNDIAETKKALDSFKNEQKIELFKNADFKKFADSIDSNLIKKNFSEVAQAVSEESERITNEIFKLTSKINQASKEISVGENVEKFTGFLDKDKTIKKQFEQFFTQTEQGLKFKPKQQNAFYEYLKEYFSLNDQQLNALKKLSAQKVQEVMTQEGYFEPQLKKAKNAATRQVSYNTQMTGLRAQAEAAAAAMGTVETAEEKIAEQSSTTEDTVRALEERIRQLELQLTGAAQASPEMKNGIAGMTGELNSMKTSLEQANAQFLQLQRQRQTFESIKSGIVNFMGFNQVLNITRNAVRAAIDHIKELDTTMNGIAIVTDMTTADLWKQVDAYSTMAQNFGVTIQGAYEVSKIYYQAGYETNDVLTLTNETLKLSKISGLDYATTTDYMMTAMRGFKLEMEDASRVVDVYSNLAANTAVSQQELAEAMTRTASSMESVGATFEETSAMIATMVAVTRESANNIGSAMKSIASRYGELTKDPAALLDADGEAMSFNKVDTALRSVGITLQTTDHQFRDFTDVIIELAEKWDTLDSAQQRYIATQFAGNRQQSRFLALVSNIDLLQENIANAENSEDVGTLQALKAMDSLESKINQVQVAYQQFYTTIGIESAWKTFLDGTRSVIDTLNSLPKLFNAIPLNAIAAISSVILVIKSVLFAGLQLVAKELKNFSTQNNQQVEDQNKEGGKRAANSWVDWFLRVWRGRKSELTSEVQGTMADATGKVLPSTAQNKPDTIDRSAQNSKKLFGTISAEGKRAAQTISMIGSAFSTLSLLINTTSQSGKVLSGTLMGLGGVITTLASAATGNVFGIVTGILNIISGISIAHESAEERLARLNKEAEELNNKAKEAKANYNTLQRSVDKLDELEKERHESAQAAEEYQTAVDELASSYPELINGINELGEITIDTASADRILAEAREKAAKATREAAKAEVKSLEERISEQEEQLEADRSHARRNLTQGSFIRTFQNVSSDGELSDETLSYVLQQELGVDDIDENLISNFRDYLEAVFSDNKEQSVKSFNTLINAAKIFFESISELAEDTEEYELNQELFSPVFEGYKELQSLQDSLRGQAKVDFLSIIDAQNSDNKINSKFLKSSGLRAFLAQDIYDDFKQREMTLDEYEQAEGTRLIEADNQWLEWYEKLGEEKQKLLDTMFSDSDIYSADDIISSLGIDDTLKSTVINYYAEINEFYKTSTEEILKELGVGFKGQKDYKYTKQDLNFWGSVNTEYGRLIKAGLETRADAFKGAQNQVFGEINQIAQKDAVSARRIKQVILDNGMSTKEGLEESLKYLESQGYGKGDKVYDQLVNAYDALIENLSIGLQAKLSSMGKELDDSLSELDKLKSGMDFEEVSNFLDKVKNLDIDIGIENFVDKDGKLALTEDAFETYWTVFQEKNLAIGDKWITLYNDLLAGTDYDYNIEQGFNREYIKEAIDSNSENLKTFAESLGATILDNDGNWLDIDTVVNNLTQAADNYREWFELLQNLSNKAKEGAKKTIDRAKGIYKNYEFDTDYTVNELKEIAKDIKLDPNSDEYAIKSSLNSAYSNLISDVLSKGFQNINLKDYEGLKDQGKDINFDNITYKDFIKEYVDFTGKSTEEINALIVQAMEKDIASTTGAAQDALRDIDFYSPTSALASRDTLQKLADALGVRIEELYDGYIESLDQYSVDVSKIPLDKITNSADILFDSINSVINSITDYINNGLSGKLKAADITNLNAQLERYGIQQLSVADFTRTKEGLQLSEQAAFRLYEDLRKIDGIQSQITFNDLAQSLKETNEHYKDFSSIIARINELDSKPSSARSEEYERELRIAKEIAAVRLTTDGGGFNFMNNSLPAGMQNPIDYMNSWGKAFKTLNEATTATGDSKNLIDATAFYNIVNELNNLAAIGDDIEFMGYTLDGSLESASELIQKGFKSLKNIDGEGTKVDLSKFGVDFASGADQMNANIENGIHELAASQVAMLDAMIQLLETIVAMEELGDIDVDSDNTLDLGEIFKVKYDERGLQLNEAYWDQFTDKFKEVAGKILADAKSDKDLMAALKNVVVNGYSLHDMFQDAIDGVKDLPIDAKAYTAVMNAFYKAAISGDYDLDNIMASIKDVLAGTGFEGEIVIGDYKLTFQYGVVLEEGKDGKYHVGDKTFNKGQEKAAARATAINSLDTLKNAGKEINGETGEVKVTSQVVANVDYDVDTQTYTINFTDEGYSATANSKAGADLAIATYARLTGKTLDATDTVTEPITFTLHQEGAVDVEVTLVNGEVTTKVVAGEEGSDADNSAEVAKAAQAIADEKAAKAAEAASGAQGSAQLDGLTATVTGEAKVEVDLTGATLTPINVPEAIELTTSPKLVYPTETNPTIDVTGLKGFGTGTLTISDCELTFDENGNAIVKKGNAIITTIPVNNLIGEGKGDLPSGNCSFKYIPGSEEIQIEFPNSDHLEIPLKNITGTGDLFSNACTISYLENGDAVIKQGDETVATITLHDLKAAGIGELPSSACTFTYNEKDGTVTVDFPNGSFTIPSEAIKAVGTLPGSGCFFKYDGSTITLYDKNGNPLAETSVDLTNVLAKGVVSQLGMTLGEGSQATLDEKTGVVSISNVIDAEGKVGTLTITPGEEGVYSGKLTGGSIDVGNVGAVNGTSSNANITATKYTIDFKSKDGKVSKTLKVTGLADITATLAGYGAGLNKENDGSVSLLDQIFASVTASLAEGTVEQLKQDIGEIPVTVSLIPKAGIVNPEYQGTDLEDAKYSGQTEGGMDILSLGSIDMPGSTTKIEVDTKDAGKDVEALQEKIQEKQTTPIDGDNRQLKASADEGKRYVESLNPVMKISGNASYAISEAQSAVAQINDMLAQIQIDAKVNVQQTTTTSDSSGAGSGTSGAVRAAGNVALAKGTKTLMGELGPELYVTNGHYYVAGQNGAEFVDLPSDAIVFNHIQTRRLLENGSAGRGHAVTNEHKATSLATGNASGPAMASASAALAALKQIRAMWDAMSKASISDLGSKAGLGKKAGGGGGNKDKGQVVKLDSGYIRDLERWYNLLRQIDRLEQDINYEEKLRSKLQADTVANGELIYESQRRTYEMLQRELDDRVELASLKKGYYEQRMAEIQAGPWGQLFYFNEEGVPQMKNLQFLADVFASSDEGGAVHNAREQYAMLQQVGFGSLLQYKEDGSVIEWTDDEGKPREEAYKEAVEAFSAKLDAQTEEVNSLREDYIEEMGNILDLQTKQNEILTQIRENTIAVEQEVLKAIEDFREREIDELQKQRDALSDSADKFIDGLTDSLNKEREMYNSQQENTELLQMRRQLAILQRSGGSASQIRSLQEQIRQREQEAYFEEQENQINAIKEASALQLERLDAQISLMQETLEYQKAHGLLWDQVHEIMQGTHEEITQFVTGNNSEWWAKSATQAQNDLVELDNKIGQWVAHRDDISALGETMKNAINNGIAAITSVVAKVSASQQYTVSGTGSYVIPSESSSSGGGGSSDSSRSSGKKKSSSSSKKTSNNSAKSWHVSASPSLSFATQSAAQEYQKKQTNLAWNSYHSNEDDEELYDEYRRWSTAHISQYSGGGLIDYTGPAWVDGTKKKPEGILNAEQLDMLRNSVLTRKNPVAALLADYGNTISNTANANTYNTINRGESMSIGNVELNMNVARIANDYDARRAGEKALEQMVKIAQKNGVNNIKRR